MKNMFPIPIVDEILDELARSKYFTTLDMKNEDSLPSRENEATR
jgi:hypothetical protein